MIKRLTGGTLIAASLIFALNQTDQNVRKTEENQQMSQSGPSAQIPVTLIDTIDGDTIKVKMNGKTETIRYLLVDTPESKKPGMCVQPFAKEAFVRNNELVQKGRLTIEFEKGNQRDDYGRLLAYVFTDGLSVQETLLKDGYARVAYIMNPPYKYLTIYRADENLAKKMKRNIWSQPNYVNNRGFNGCVE